VPQLLGSLARNRRLLREFVVRDLKARYVGSSMGFFWSVIYPVLNLFTYMFVFRLVLKIRFEDQASPADTAIWMLAGITVWVAFAESVSRTTNCLVENSNLIQKVVFPSEVLPVYLVSSSLINMCIGLPVVLGGVAWFAYLGPWLFPEEVHTASLAVQEILTPPVHRDLALGLPIAALPLLMFLQGLFTIGLGCLLATLNLFLRDTFHLVGVFVTVWMFATPIFYPDNLVTEAEHGRYAWLLDVNPMYWLIESYRSVLLFAHWPDPWMLGRFTAVALATFLLGSTFFMRQKPIFPDLL
jgi:lipopolysaccharide transport system permease protein